MTFGPSGLHAVKVNSLLIYSIFIPNSIVANFDSMSFFELINLCRYIAARNSNKEVQPFSRNKNINLTTSLAFYDNNSIHTLKRTKVVTVGSEISAIFNISQYHPFLTLAKQFLSIFAGERWFSKPIDSTMASTPDRLGRNAESTLAPKLMHELFMKLPFFPVRLSTRPGWISPGPHSPVMRA